MEHSKFIGTIADDVQIVYKDASSDSDVDMVKPRQRLKKGKRRTEDQDFASDFTFNDKPRLPSTVTDSNSLNHNDHLLNMMKRKRSRTSLDDKILKIRKEKLQGARSKGQEDANGKTATADSEERWNSDQAEMSSEDEGESSGHSDLEISDVLKTKDRKKKYKKKQKQEKPNGTEMPEECNSSTYFEQYSPQVDYELLEFSDMNLSRPLLKAVNAMNLSKPTPIQSVAIPVALQGRDICACASTGTGKTLAFMLPILERLLYRPHSGSHRGTAVTRVLVLSPTRELAVQIYTVTRQLTSHFTQATGYLSVALAAGGLDVSQQEAALRQNPDIVIATPGRLIDHLHNAPSFTVRHVEVLVLDEADRMLDEYFAEQMKEVIRQCSPTRQTMLFSATMTEEVSELASVSLRQPVKLFVNSNQQVASNLRQEFIRVRANREADREPILAALLTRTFQQRVIVFTQTKKQSHRLHILLGLLGLPSGVAEMHGDLTQQQRLEALKRFKEGAVQVLVCTDLAARGLDIEGVKTVINFTLPSTLKHYVHRVGRTARAGNAGRSVSLCGESERKVLKQIIKAAREPVKSRVIPAEVISSYRGRVRAVEADVAQVLTMERAESEMTRAEGALGKAQRVLTGPPSTTDIPHSAQQQQQQQQHRNWFQTPQQRKLDTKNQKLGGISSSGKGKKDKLSKPEKKKKGADSSISGGEVGREILKAQQYAARAAKRRRKPQRIRVFTEHITRPTATQGVRGKNSIDKRKQKKKQSSFNNELTNTSRKEVKRLRYSGRQRDDASGSQKKPKKAAGGKFKSKKKFKRR